MAKQGLCSRVRKQFSINQSTGTMERCQIMLLNFSIATILFVFLNGLHDLKSGPEEADVTNFLQTHLQFDLTGLAKRNVSGPWLPRQDAESRRRSRGSAVQGITTRFLSSSIQTQFVHQGHCNRASTGTSSGSQSSLQECAEFCANQGDNVGYLAYRTSPSKCACYYTANGCPDGNNHHDYYHDYNAYRILRRTNVCAWAPLGRKKPTAHWTPCSNATLCKQYRVESTYGNSAGWTSKAKARKNCARWDDCVGYWEQTNGYWWAMDAGAMEFQNLVTTSMSNGTYQKNCGSKSLSKAVKEEKKGHDPPVARPRRFSLASKAENLVKGLSTTVKEEEKKKGHDTSDAGWRRTGPMQAAGMAARPRRFADASTAVAYLESAKTYNMQAPCHSDIHGASRQHESLTGNWCEPWIARYAIEFLGRVLEPTDVVLEYGSGSSSAWLLLRVQSVISIEHCRSWLDTLAKSMPSIVPTAVLQNWHAHWIPADNAKEAEDCGPEYTRSSRSDLAERESMEKLFQKYATLPFTQSFLTKVPNAGYDVIYVDNKNRIECVALAIKHLKNYGLLLVDNIQYPHVEKAAAQVPSFWLNASFQNSYTTTIIWMRCSSADDVNCAEARVNMGRPFRSLASLAHQHREQHTSTSAAGSSRGWHQTSNCKVPPPHGSKFFSQSNEDVHLYNAFFCNVTNGVFVEMGALDGVKWSNTKFFDDFLGWSGALIEASPRSSRQLKENRKNPRNSIFAEGVCPEGQRSMRFIENNEPAVSGGVASMSDSFLEQWHTSDKHGEEHIISVPCRTLSAILKEFVRRSGADHVDFFSLDVEGGEFQVLKTFDFEVPVNSWIIEMDGLDKEKDENVRQLLREHGYVRSRVEDFNNRNEIWVIPSLDP